MRKYRSPEKKIMLRNLSIRRQTETRMSWTDNLTTRTGLSLSEAVRDTSNGQQCRWIGKSTMWPTLETQSVKRAQPIFIALRIWVREQSRPLSARFSVIALDADESYHQTQNNRNVNNGIDSAASASALPWLRPLRFTRLVHLSVR